jgi:predicted PurR-regulated permease PerM
VYGFVLVRQEDSAVTVTIESRFHDNDFTNRAIDVAIHIGLLALLAAACLAILWPFLSLIAWGIIVAIAVYPGYRKLKDVLGGRGGVAAVLCTVFLLAILFVPVALLTETLIEGSKSIAAQLKDGTLTVPPPPPKLETWPIIGVPLKSLWSLASTNLTAALRSFAPQIKAILPRLLSASAGVGLTVLQFVLSILISGGFLAYARSGGEAARSLANRLFGDNGPEFEELVVSTIRSVTIGILGVAFIQSIFAGVGFLVVGLPGAGLWAVSFLLAAVLQVGPIVLIPAVIYIFMIASTTKAVIFLIWCIIVGLMDNVLKPLLLGRGAAVPIAVVFLGVIGGFMAMGIIGLFVGAIVLSVGYKLLLAWVAQ